MKNMFKEDSSVNGVDDRTNGDSLSRNDADYDRTSSTRADGNTNYDNDLSNDSSRLKNLKRASYKLSSGTGPGTLGKNVRGTTAQQNPKGSRADQGVAGYGTNAATTADGSLSGNPGTRHVPGASGCASFSYYYHPPIFLMILSV